MSATRTAVIRVAFEGDQTRQQLERLGQDGERALDRVRGAAKAADPALQGVASASDGLARSMGGMASSLASPAALLAAFGAAATASTVAVAKAGDAMTQSMARLGAATGSVSSAVEVYGRLEQLARQTGIAVSESAGAFSRFAVASRSIGATNEQVIALVRTVQQAGIVAGASTQETASAVQQLGQGLASGKLAGDELKSIMENLPNLAEALARELGVSVGELRKMGSEGQLTADRIMPALLRAGERINEQFNQMPPTMSRAFDVLGVSMTGFLAQLDRALGLSQGVASALNAAARGLQAAQRGITPSTPAEQADADIAGATGRVSNLEAELRRLESGGPVASRRGSTQRAMQEAAAQADPSRLDDMRARLAEENRILLEARERRSAIARGANEADQGEQATAAARSAAAARTRTTLAFNETRDGLDKERKLREDHRVALESIERGRLNSDIDAAGATRLRRIANDELADGLRGLNEATGRRVETDEDLARVAAVVADIEKDRLALLREGVTITQSVRTEQEKYAEQLGILRTLLDRGAISQETFNRALAAADPAQRASRQAAEETARSAQSAANSMEANFTGAFTRAFEAGENAGQSFLTSIKNGVKSLAVSIASQLIFRMAVVPTVNAGASALGFAGNFLAAPNTAIGGGGFGSFFGGSGGTTQAASPAQSGGFMGQASSASSIYRSLSGNNPTDLINGTRSINTGFGSIDGYLNTPIWAGSASAGINAGGAATNAAGYGSMAANSIDAAGSAAAAGVGSTGLSVGGAALGAAGIAGGAYGIYSGFQKGGVGGGLQVAGGALSAGLAAAAMASMAVPVVGWIAAAVLSIAGALAPGQKPSGMGQESRIDLYTGDQKYRGLGGDRYSPGNRGRAEDVVESLASLSAQLGEKLGGAKIGGDVAVGVTNDKLYLEVNGQKGQFSNDEAGNKALAASATKMIIQAFYDQGAAKGVYRQIIERTGSDSLEKLGENLQWYETVYKGFDTTEVAATAFTKQMDALKESFQGNIDKAHSFGLSSAAMEAARDKQVAELNAARGFAMMDTLYSLQVPGSLALGQGDVGHTASVAQADARAGQQLKALKDQLIELGLSAEATADWVSYLTNVQAAQRTEAERQRTFLLNDTLYGLQARGMAAWGDETGGAAIATAMAANRAANELEALRQQLVSLGTSSEDAASWVSYLTQVQAAEAESATKAAASTATARTDPQATQAGAGSALGVVTSLREYSARLSTTDAGAGTALDRVSAAQRQFDAVFGAASAGNGGSISGLQGAAEAYRLASREVFGGGQGYADAVRLIAERINSIGGIGADALTQSFVTENARENTDRIVDALANLRTENAALRRDLNLLLMRPAA